MLQSDLKPQVIDEANSIFQQPWWLDAVAPGNWDVVEVKKGGSIIARLPFVLQQGPLGLRLLVTPKLTHTLGPWLKPQEGKYTSVLSHQKELLSRLIDGLPNFDLYAQKFHYSVTNWLPFYWRGFQQTTFYTYVIEDLSDLDSVFGAFDKSSRYEIRKAARQLSVRSDYDLDVLWKMVSLTFERQGKKVPYTFEYLQRIDDACVQQNARRILFAEDAKGRVHSALYLIWDKNSAYYLIGGADPELRSSGSSSLLIWEAIQFAATVTSRFDFEGSMVESIERFFRGFGAQQKPYFYVTKSNSLFTNEIFVKAAMKLPFLRRIIQ